MHYHRRYFIFKEYDFEDILKNVAPVLKELGFKGSGQNYRRVSEKAVAVVNFQKSSTWGRFYINLGVQPLFFINEKDGYDIKNVKEYECIFRKRVDPQDKRLHWMHPMKPKYYEEMKGKIEAACHEYIEPLLLMDNLLKEYTVEQFQRNEPPWFLEGVHASACPLLARIALADGDTLKAGSFVEYGLTMCKPQARGLRYDLERLKKEIEDKEKSV
jgi:hypothetical protein